MDDHNVPDLVIFLVLNMKLIELKCFVVWMWNVNLFSWHLIVPFPVPKHDYQFYFMLREVTDALYKTVNSYIIREVTDAQWKNVNRSMIREVTDALWKNCQ